MDAERHNGVDPKQSITRLHKLVRRGFTNEMHCPYIISSHDTIAGHIRYCKNTGEFRDDETNAALQSRFRYIRDTIDEQFGDMQVIDALTLQRLVKESFRRYSK